MGRILLLFILLCWFFPTYPQGIRFESNTSWESVKSKANRENKYIFVDCFATWCGPCKWMNANILSKREVGNFFNSMFVSVAIQMDQTPNDSKDIKSWYIPAKEIAQIYGVTAFPTYLFFSSDGKVLHKIVGSIQSEEEFINKVKDGLNPANQYYKLINDYKLHEGDSVYLRNALQKAVDNYDKVSAQIIGNYYFACIKDLFTNENLSLMVKSTWSSSDRGFSIFLNNATKINEILGEKEASERLLVDNVLSIEEIDPLFEKNNKKLSWLTVSAAIRNKYPPLSDKLIKLLLSRFKSKIIQTELPAPSIHKPVNWEAIADKVKEKYPGIDLNRMIDEQKHRYYYARGQWVESGKAAAILLEKYGNEMTNFQINNVVWDYIFERCSDLEAVRTGVKWSKISVDRNPGDYQLIDTYACLLYKSGQVKNAIEWENKAIHLVESNGNPDPESFKNFQNNVQKMILGEPIWIDSTPVFKN